MKTSIIGMIVSALIIVACYFIVVPADNSQPSRPATSTTPSGSSDDSALGNLK